MKENETSPAPQSSAQTLLPISRSPEAEAAEALESMLEENSVPADTPSMERVIGSLPEHLKTIVDSITSLQKDTTGIRTEMQRIKTDDRVLTEMQDRCRELNERHYEREVLGPFLLTAIGIADRCRQQITRLQKMLQKHNGARNQAALLAIRQILDARAADRIEIESVLANYGVEPFEQLSEKFDPATQKCVSRIECRDSSLHGQVSQRLLPGYRRQDRVIRQEYVSVYVFNQIQGNISKGEKP